MRNLPRIITIAILVYLLLGVFWIFGMVRHESLFQQAMGYIYGVPILLAAGAVLGVFQKWITIARVLALIAIAPAIPVVIGEGVRVLGFPIPIGLPVTLGVTLRDGFYGLGFELIPAILFIGAWYAIKPEAPEAEPPVTEAQMREAEDR